MLMKEERAFVFQGGCAFVLELKRQYAAWQVHYCQKKLGLLE
jgi:hypothetical protein